MELGMRQFRWHEQLDGIIWNSVELGVRQFQWQQPFIKGPRNLCCHQK